MFKNSKSKFKKQLAKAMLSLTLVGSVGASVMPVSAETKTFSVTATQGTNFASARASKSASAYENCGYITPTYFSKDGSVICWIQNVRNASIKTEEVALAKGTEGVTRYRYYIKSATTSEKYMVGTRGAVVHSGSNEIVLKGRYTP